MGKKDPKFEACVAKYRQLRKLTRDQLEEEALRAFRLQIKVTAIDEDVEDALALWTSRLVPFRWTEDILPTHRMSHPDGLDLALWKDKQLCGVAVARLSDNKEWLSLTYIEGAPGAHPLKSLVVPLLLVGADIYATLVQHLDVAQRLPVVRIMRPLPGSIGWYAKCGYSQSQKANGYTFVTRSQP